jgi:hypothetical protein
MHQMYKSQGTITLFLEGGKTKNDMGADIDPPKDAVTLDIYSDSKTVKLFITDSYNAGTRGSPNFEAFMKQQVIRYANDTYKNAEVYIRVTSTCYDGCAISKTESYERVYPAM